MWCGGFGLFIFWDPPVAGVYMGRSMYSSIGKGDHTRGLDDRCGEGSGRGRHDNRWR